MKWHWQRRSKLMEINPSKYFYDVEMGVLTPIRFCPSGGDPLSLHSGMFMSAVIKLGSDE